MVVLCCVVLLQYNMSQGGQAGEWGGGGEGGRGEGGHLIFKQNSATDLM